MITLSFDEDVSEFAKFDIIKCLKILHHNVHEMSGEYYITKDMIFYQGESIGYERYNFIVQYLKTFDSPFVVPLDPVLKSFLKPFKDIQLKEGEPIYFVGNCNFQKIDEYNAHQKILLTTNISFQSTQQLIDKVKIFFVGIDLPYYLQSLNNITHISTTRSMSYFIYNHYFSLNL